jgi:hypothetical protein
MNRRDAVRRISVLLGGAISAPTLTGLLHGCGQATDQRDYVPRTLTPDQFRLVRIIADHVIPTTDTPGAAEAGVHRFIDEMLTDFYTEEERTQFLAELAHVDDASRSVFGQPFARLDRGQQIELLGILDADAFPDEQEDPDGVARTAARVAGGDPPFMRTMKELTISGYYTSQIGQTVELRPVPFGPYRGDVPFNEVGRAWA